MVVVKRKCFGVSGPPVDSHRFLFLLVSLPGMTIDTALFIAGEVGKEGLPFAAPPPDHTRGGARFESINEARMQIALGGMTPDRLLEIGVRIGNFDPKTCLVKDLSKANKSALSGSDECRIFRSTVGYYVSSSLDGNLLVRVIDRPLQKKVICIFHVYRSKWLKW